MTTPPRKESHDDQFVAWAWPSMVQIIVVRRPLSPLFVGPLPWKLRFLVPPPPESIQQNAIFAIFSNLSDSRIRSLQGKRGDPYHSTIGAAKKDPIVLCVIRLGLTTPHLAE